MYRTVVCLALACVVFAIGISSALAEKKKLEITKKWNGSVANEKAKKPDAIVSQKGLEAVWKEWKIDEDVPKVDFTKDIVVAVYSSGSKLNMSAANLDDKGDLTVVGFGTRDLRPGFRYVLGVVSKEGIKTVNKKDLPKE